MEENYWNEEWKEIDFNSAIPSRKYHVSSHGRVRRVDNVAGIDKLLKGAYIRDYRVVSFGNDSNGKNVYKYVHKLVAECFVNRPDELHEFVIHTDHNNKNNHFQNLKWVTKEDRYKHQNLSPKSLKVRKNKKNYKLNEETVKLIKKKIFDPNRKTRLKMIARQFGISEMQLYRIKSGENWGDVDPD